MNQEEQLKGVGIVTTDYGRRIPVEYNLYVQLDRNSGRQLRSARGVRGSVIGVADSTFVYVYFGQDMMLETEQGDQIRFFHVDIDGNVAITEWIK